MGKYPLLCHQAGGGPWLTFQTRIYGNVLRGIALLQICLMLPAHLLNRSGHREYSLPLFAVLGLDSVIFVIFGPTPFAPLGCLAQSIVWQRRGSIVPLLPYKVTMLYYFVAALAALTCPADATSGVCELLNSNGVAYTLMMNSIYLTIFRF